MVGTLKCVDMRLIRIYHNTRRIRLRTPTDTFYFSPWKPLHSLYNHWLLTILGHIPPLLSALRRYLPASGSDFISRFSQAITALACW